MTTRTPYTVLLIGGAGRSGSTLLERMLDQVPGVVAVGELTDLWDSALVRGERCGCGVPFAKCEFWSHVGDHAFGGWDRIDAGGLLAVHDSVARNRHVPLLLTAPLLPSVKEKVDRYAAAFSRIYGGIAAASGSNLIVDASKWPSHALVLRRIPGLDLRMVHLVRDPRGVAHSWATSVERPQALGGSSGVEMRRYRPTAAALHWTTINVGIDIASALGIPRHFLRYEQLIASPRETLLGALEHAGLVPAEGGLDFIDDGVVRLAPGHGIAGNRLRFRHGEIRLRQDKRWATEMPWRTRMAVNSLTFPVALSYRGRGDRGSLLARG